jgi:hydrogenase nickel incorporation protein HypB
MCATCGCGIDDTGDPGGGTRMTVLTTHDHPHPNGHAHDHEHPHPHPHPHPGDAGRVRALEVEILAKNDELAAANRRWMAEHRVTTVNLMSSPGSGKTTLLVRTLHDLGMQLPVAVVEGDQETLLDAERIHATGAPVVQVNTGAACHLDAAMLAGAMRELAPADGSLMFVENVGNLVCPALFDLGETAKVVVISVTEGDDKPLKYPQMFAGADLVVVNKADLLPYVDFDVDRCVENARRVRPSVHSVVVSATRGDGLSEWYRWLLRPANGPAD